MTSTRQRLLLAVAPRVGYAYLKLLRLTMRLEYRNRDALQTARENAGQYILAFWHSRFAMMPYAYPDRRLVVLHSEHRDARLVAEMMKKFGLAQAWGSTTRGGAKGLRMILRRIKEGYDVGMTPDGPRGPRRQVHPGLIGLARLSGKPIVPVAFSTRPYRRLESWDRTLVPFPFGRGVYVYGDPIHVPKQTDEEATREFVERVGRELDRLTDESDAIVGIPPEDPEVAGRG